MFVISAMSFVTEYIDHSAKDKTDWHRPATRWCEYQQDCKFRLKLPMGDGFSSLIF